jgi:hypothetical protein
MDNIEEIIEQQQLIGVIEEKAVATEEGPFEEKDNDPENNSWFSEYLYVLENINICSIQ